MPHSTNALKSAEKFFSELILKFPELEEEILDPDYAELVSLQIGCFKRFTQDAINTGNQEKVKACFRFAEENFENVVFAVANSLAISYAGKLDFSKNPDAEKLLGPKLTEIRKALIEHYNSPPKDERVKTFLNSLEKKRR